MIIPPFDLTHIANDDGTPHPKFKQLMDMLITNMNANLSNEGYKLPQQPTTVVQQLNTPQSESAVIYDNTTKQAKLNINGTFKTLATVA
jgi:hypothetical protein